MKWFMYLLVTTILAACTGNTDVTAPKPTDVPVTSPVFSRALGDGETIYAIYCAECHGENGEGQNPEDPFNGDVAPPHNATGHTWHHDDDLLIQIVTEGGITNTMPAFEERLTSEQIEIVLEFIKSLWTNEQRAYQDEVTRVSRGR